MPALPSDRQWELQCVTYRRWLKGAVLTFWQEMRAPVRDLKAMSLRMEAKGVTPMPPPTKTATSHEYQSWWPSPNGPSRYSWWHTGVHATIRFSCRQCNTVTARCGGYCTRNVSWCQVHFVHTFALIIKKKNSFRFCNNSSRKYGNISLMNKYTKDTSCVWYNIYNVSDFCRFVTWKRDLPRKFACCVLS